MDNDTADLIRQLCARAGMIMEDVSARAICVDGVTKEEFAAVAAEIESAGHDTAALGKAARTLIGR